MLPAVDLCNFMIFVDLIFIIQVIPFDPVQIVYLVYQDLVYQVHVFVNMNRSLSVSVILYLSF